jgi:hypothetical protein
MIEPSIVTAAFVPIAALAIWWTVRRIQKKNIAGEDEPSSSFAFAGVDASRHSASGSRFHNISRRKGDCDRPELLVYFVMSASSAIINVLQRHDVIARRTGTLPLCLTALPFPQFQIERLEKRLPHTNAGGCFAYHPKPSFQADAQHGSPNVSRDGSVRDLNARQGV